MPRPPTQCCLSVRNWASKRARDLRRAVWTRMQRWGSATIMRSKAGRERVQAEDSARARAVNGWATCAQGVAVFERIANTKKNKGVRAAAAAAAAAAH